MKKSRLLLLFPLALTLFSCGSNEDKSATKDAYVEDAQVMFAKQKKQDKMGAQVTDAHFDIGADVEGGDPITATINIGDMKIQASGLQGKAEDAKGSIEISSLRFSNVSGVSDTIKNYLTTKSFLANAFLDGSIAYLDFSKSGSYVLTSAISSIVQEYLPGNENWSMPSKSMIDLSVISGFSIGGLMNNLTLDLSFLDKAFDAAPDAFTFSEEQGIKTIAFKSQSDKTIKDVLASLGDSKLIHSYVDYLTFSHVGLSISWSKEALVSQSLEIVAKQNEAEQSSLASVPVSPLGDINMSYSLAFLSSDSVDPLTLNDDQKSGFKEIEFPKF